MEKTMAYREYKKEWDNRKTVKGSYNAETKTVTVIIPESLWDLSQIIPASEIEAFRAELIASGNSEFADLSHITELYANDLHGASVDEFDYPEEEKHGWIAKAIEAANRYYL